jgi:NAD(P)-dependent dehydrogenase (short-subunit alcohol dehydrogenase family)
MASVMTGSTQAWQATCTVSCRITVNAVGPGSTMSGPFGQMTAEQKTEVSSAFALGRIGEPTDTAGIVALLAFEDAGFVTGQVISNAGGRRGPVGLDR